MALKPGLPEWDKGLGYKCFRAFNPGGLKWEFRRIRAFQDPNHQDEQRVSVFVGRPLSVGGNDP